MRDRPANRLALGKEPRDQALPLRFFLAANEAGTSVELKVQWGDEIQHLMHFSIRDGDFVAEIQALAGAMRRCGLPLDEDGYLKVEKWGTDIVRRNGLDASQINPRSLGPIRIWPSIDETIEALTKAIEQVETHAATHHIPPAGLRDARKLIEMQAARIEELEAAHGKET